MERTILKNSAWLLTAQGVGKAIAFIYTIFLARNLGVSNFGLYIVALSYFSLISTIADFGISRFLIREISVDKNRLGQLLFNATVLRLGVMFSLFIVFTLAVGIFDTDYIRGGLSSLAVLAILPQTVALTLDCAFVALQKLKISALGLFILSVSTVISGFLLINAGLGSVGAIVALILGQLIYVTVLFLMMLRLRINFFSRLSFKLIKEIVAESVPYGLVGILGLLYYKIDAVLLSYIKGSFDAGIYGAAYKFLEAAVFVPSAMSAALFPVLAKLTAEAPQRVYNLYIKATFIFLGVSLIVLLGYLTILPFIITKFLPQYLPAIAVIQVLSLTLPFFFMIAPQSTLLSSHRKFIKPLTFISIFNLTLNVFLNLLLIPHYSYMGAAAVTVMSDLIGFIIFFFLIRHYFYRVS